MNDPRKLRSALSRTLIGWRSEKHLSQEQLAQLCGLTRQYISRLEAGRQIPKLDSLQKILSAFGKSFLDFGKNIDSALYESSGAASRMAAERPGPIWNEK